MVGMGVIWAVIWAVETSRLEKGVGEGELVVVMGVMVEVVGTEREVQGGRETDFCVLSGDCLLGC